MRILVSGSRGLIGSALIPMLQRTGHDIGRLVRPGTPARPGDVTWDPDRGNIDNVALEGVDGVVHLAGEPIGRIVGPEAMKFGGWQRLNAEYAKQFAAQTPGWPGERT